MTTTGTIGGEVIYFDAERGIGFATGMNGNRYVFDRHDLGAVESVAKGARIAFRPEGDRARDIALAQPAARAPAAPPAAAGVPATAVGVPAGSHAVPTVPGGAAPGLFGYFRRAIGASYANFRGRARRKEYWGFVLFAALAMVLAAGIGFMLGQMLGIDEERDPVVTSIAIGFTGLLLLIPSLAVTVRRQHDIGLSGWFLLLWLIPTVGALIVLVFTLIPSQKHENRWGPVPDGIRP